MSYRAQSRYGPGTWEFICAITFRAAATELALFLENMAASFAGTGDSRSELAALRASAKVYEYQFKVSLLASECTFPFARHLPGDHAGLQFS